MVKKNKAAAALGKKGGKAGIGKAKARTTEQARAAARTRWKKHNESHPGPWTVETNNAYQTSWLIMDARGNRLAQVANWQDKCRNVDGEANAKLMASAPDLLAAMKHIHDTLKHIAECASIPERDAEELAVYVSGFLPNTSGQPHPTEHDKSL